MNRQPGYYWVRLSGSNTWFVHEFNGVDWCEEEGMGGSVSDSWFSEINETRIPSPGEVGVMRDLFAGNTPTSPSEVPQNVKNFVEANRDLYDIFFNYFRGHE